MARWKLKSGARVDDTTVLLEWLIHEKDLIISPSKLVQRLDRAANAEHKALCVQEYVYDYVISALEHLLDEKLVDPQALRTAIHRSGVARRLAPRAE